MEIQKVISSLEHYKNEILYSPKRDNYRDVVKNLESAVYVLNKAVPAKLHSMWTDYGDAVLYCCPICGKDVTFTFKGELASKYCPRCGQKLAWDSKNWDERIANERRRSS